MADRKESLRTLSPTARRVARLEGELESIGKRLHNTIPTLQQLDMIEAAFENQFTPRDFEFGGPIMTYHTDDVPDVQEPLPV